MRTCTWGDTATKDMKWDSSVTKDHEFPTSEPNWNDKDQLRHENPISHSASFDRTLKNLFESGFAFCQTKK